MNFSHKQASVQEKLWYSGNLQYFVLQKYLIIGMKIQ